MKNIDKPQALLLFAVQAGDAVCELLGDRWMLLEKEARAADPEAFADFCARQKDNLFRIALSGSGTEVLSSEEALRTAGEILASPHVSAFFSAAREDFAFALAALAELVTNAGEGIGMTEALAAVRAKMRLRAEEREYRAYVTDALRLLTENTAKMSGGGYLREEYADSVDGESEKTAADILGKIREQLRR